MTRDQRLANFKASNIGMSDDDFNYIEGAFNKNVSSFLPMLQNLIKFGLVPISDSDISSAQSALNDLLTKINAEIASRN